jgi:hypothetical protein
MATRLAVFTLSLSSAFTADSTPASQTTPARLYEVVTETGMPHLEENLRYAITRENRCLTSEDLASAFPVLGHASLADCSCGTRVGTVTPSHISLCATAGMERRVARAGASVSN